MNESFEIGEIAVLKDLPEWVQEYNNDEVLITGPLEYRRTYNPYVNVIQTELCYAVEHRGKSLAMAPQYLKKRKQPPAEDASELNQKVSWERCAWRPREVEAA